MRIHLFTLILCCFSTVLFAQQITVDNTQSPQQLIENNLVQGCVEVANISSSINGSVNGFSSFGYFENANSNFPFANGIVLSTGNVMSAGNVVNTNALNEGDTNWTTDTDLETALGITNTLNATSISFDFTSATGTIQFNYILASEEYFADYPCNYSDGFAFLIKEAGTSQPYQNIAVIPNTSSPVNTSTIHEEIVGFCDAENENYFEGYNIGDTNFNGRTTVLSASAAITPNVQYSIKLIIADQTDRNFDSAVFIEGNSFSDSVDLGNDFSTCDASTTLDASTNNPQATYQWYLDNNVLNGETSSQLNVVTSGNYNVVITVPLNNTTCTFQDDINVTLNSIQAGTNLSDYELCDDISNDGTETFDLTSLTSTVNSNLPPATYSISYHISNQNAIDNVNAFNTLNNFINPQVIYIRAQDINSGCVYISTVNLVVNPFPVITQPTDREICTNSDGTVMLTESDNEITNGNTNYSVTYHYSQTDADSGANPIDSPYAPTNINEQLIVRVVDVSTGCLTYTDINISVLDAPNVNTETQQISACEQDDDGFEFFDLTSVINDVLQGNTTVNVTYHVSTADAETGANPIPDPTNFENTQENLQSVYIRVENQNNSCFEIIPIQLHTNILDTGTNIQNFGTCDNAPDDGSAEFDLEAITLVIANDLPNITISYFETEADLNSNINAVDTSLPYTTTSILQSLHILIEDSTCSYTSEIELFINPSVTIQTQAPVNYCDINDDAMASVELAIFNTIVSTGIDTPTVSYYASVSDAEAETNALPPFYDHTTNPFTVFVRVSTTSGCYDVASLEITVLPAPTAIAPSDFVICDDDQDGFSIIDLTSKEGEISANPSSVNFSYYLNEQDANANINEITNPSAFNAQTEEVIAKVANPSTLCYALIPINIIVNTLPDFIAISNFSNCETDGNQISDFIFADKDAEILNGQTGKTVSYFETEANAIANTNAIDKNNIYNNTSQTQTIYARVENLTDQSCFGTTSFTIEVGSEPIYNAPIDINICDDISNDGFETFDLNDQRNAIIANSTDMLTVSFYLNQADADNEVNALPDTFTNTVNPQQIFAKVDNGTYCQSIATFEFNVIQVPEINSATDLQQCDINADGFAVFDLTNVEVEVLAIRQDNTVITYYPSETDMLANTNPILNPNNYTNTSNPQTVYIEVTNTISNCSVSVNFDLIVDLPPVVASIGTFETCYNIDNTFDLTTIISDLIGTQSNVTTTFHANTNDADLNQNPLNTDYVYNSNNDTIYVRAQFLNTGCYNTHSFNLVVNEIPTATPADLNTCDDDFDAFMFFDLSQQTATVLGNQNPTNFTVSYFETENDAISNTNAILDLNYEAENEQTLYVRVENNITGCFTTNSFITFVNRKPDVAIEDQVVCIDNLPLVVTAETNEPTDSYLWSTGATTSEIEITTIGNYSVTVTTILGCTTTSSFSVSASQQALVDFEVSAAFQDPHTVIVETSGIGNYVYQFNDEEPQESNVFNNAPIGIHYITVIDLNGCETTPPKKITIIDAPQFITPNGDGYFDTWHITGVGQLPGTVVRIHDRYGKILKVLKHNDFGWDGRYNGNLMPASDYWFVADVVNGGEKFQVKGHFALRL